MRGGKESEADAAKYMTVKECLNESSALVENIKNQRGRRDMYKKKE